MKDKVNQMFKDKLFLVMMVIGLLTAVAAVGVLTVSNTDEKGQSLSGSAGRRNYRTGRCS